MSPSLSSFLLQNIFHYTVEVIFKSILLHFSAYNKHICGLILKNYFLFSTRAQKYSKLTKLALIFFRFFWLAGGKSHCSRWLWWHQKLFHFPVFKEKNLSCFSSSIKDWSYTWTFLLYIACLYSGDALYF